MHPSIKNLLNGEVPLNSTVTLQGWVRSRRDSKAGVSFLAISDGSCFSTLQAVVPESLPNYASEVLKLTKDCSVSVQGTLVASEGKEQNVEIQATHVEVLGWIEDPETYPVSPKRHSMEYLREHAHLRPRTNTFGAVSRVRASVAQAIHRFFHDRGFFWVNTPIITASDCEGAGELFRVSTLDLQNLPRTTDGKIDFSKDFFGKEAYLTVSGQLNAECYALALSKVYTFGPTFRAENSNTSRHLAEFWMVEPEVAFADLQSNVKLAEDMLRYVIQFVLNERQDDLAFFNEWVDKTCLQRLTQLVNSTFAQIDYTEAIRILEKSGHSFEYTPKWGTDLQTEHERYLCEHHVKGPVTIVNY
ncbi:MAG: asparagine--tRNA ligase, partial [Gammaproteobacteria bacterium]|nr:asparagine--tRNA ligase [Gammaproteobacteria bacterium]